MLNGGNLGKVGLAKSVDVLPGDKVSAEVFAKYRSQMSSPGSGTFINALAAAFNVSSASTGTDLLAYNALDDYADMVAGGEHPGDDDVRSQPS